MLELKGLSKHFGGVRAVDELDLKVNEGEILGLIGPNGSGKSTTVNLVCGVFPATTGSIMFQDRDVGRMAPHKRSHLGIARTFQNIRLFGHLTVWQNLWVSRNSPQDVAAQSFLSRWFGRTSKTRKEIEATLEFSGLAAQAEELASNLAFGEQRRLELARAAATRPKLLMLDEPAAGMSLKEVKDLSDRIRSLRDSGMTILLVEHVMELVMGVTDRIAVLNFGKKIAEGTPTEIQNNEHVQQAYLGSGDDAPGA